MFLIIFETDFVNYAVDNTPYVLGDSIDDVIKSFEDDSIIFSKWFLDKQMKANSNKRHLITSKNRKY